jgi:phospholipid/cholesterol/gamma-HCH transport system substrate-binding protein
MALKEETELKVGIFILVGIVVLTFLVFSIGDIEILRRGYTVNLRFNDAGGLRVGALVTLLGVEAGEVRKIDFIYNEELQRKQVELLLWIKEGNKIGENSTAKVKRQGVMGEKYVEIILGDAEAKILKEGDIFYGEAPVALEDVAEEIYLISDELKKAIFYINDILGDKQTREDVKDTARNIREASENLNELSADIRRHPWKLFIRTKEKDDEDKEEKARKEEKKGFIIQGGP